jgi:hypothetical protein
MQQLHETGLEVVSRFKDEKENYLNIQSAL